jgi:hypothetical protein
MAPQDQPRALYLVLQAQPGSTVEELVQATGWPALVVLTTLKRMAQAHLVRLQEATSEGAAHRYAVVEGRGI